MALFIPWIQLDRESTERYSLTGTVVVPNNTTRIAGMALGETPTGVRIPRSFFPVQLILAAVETTPQVGSLQLHMPLDYRATGPAALPVGGKTGYTHVAVYSVINGTVVGKNHLRVPEPGKDTYPESAMLPPCERWGWTAWREGRPDGTRPLRVHGFFEADSLGYVGTLSFAVPQGIDADVLLLRLEFRAVDGVHPFQPVKIPVQYHDPRPANLYRLVQVVYPSETTGCQFSVLDLGDSVGHRESG